MGTPSAPPPPGAPAAPGAAETPTAASAPAAPTAAPAAPGAPPAPKDDATEKARLSGKHWQASANSRWPASSSVDTLSDGFKPKVQSFIKALDENKIGTEITATLRPKELAYLFHFCLEVASGRVKPSEVERLATVDINWDHGDDAKSMAAAKEMADAWGLVGIAAYPSNHSGGNAIDMKMDFSKNTNKDGKNDLVYKLGDKEVKREIKIADEATTGVSARGKSISDITDRELSKAGQDFGVIRAIKSDIVHWSSTGT